MMPEHCKSCTYTKCLILQPIKITVMKKNINNHNNTILCNYWQMDKISEVPPAIGKNTLNISTGIDPDGNLIA